MTVFSPGEGGGGGTPGLGILGRVVPLDSLNPDPISDQKMSFSTPVFRPDLYMKCIPVFRPGLLAEIMLASLRLERK